MQRDKATAAFFNLTECLEPPSSCPSLRAASCMNRFCAVIPGILRIQGAGFSQFCTMDQTGRRAGHKAGSQHSSCPKLNLLLRDSKFHEEQNHGKARLTSAQSSIFPKLQKPSCYRSLHLYFWLSMEVDLNFLEELSSCNILKQHLSFSLCEETTQKNYIIYVINSFGRKKNYFFSSLLLASKYSFPYILCQKVSALSLPHSSPSQAIHAQALKDSKRQADLHQENKER